MNTLDNMLRARSVAVVGASSRPGSVGEQTLHQLLAGGFAGEIHPVNPGYEEIRGLVCHHDIRDADGPIDLAVLAVGNAQLETETTKAIAAGARSLAIFASCHGTAAGGGPLREKIAAAANEAGIPVCGGNGMGFVNVEDALRICGFYQPELLRPGGTTFLSHSGSLFSAMLHNRRRLDFNLVVSTGLELNTPMSAYMDWALDLDSTKVIALFLETIRDPEGFRRSLMRASEADVPVVALKVGASALGQAAVATHSEAIAGDDAVYAALFDHYGVHRVWSMDEMADTVELLSTVRATRPGGLGAVHDSGGERALLIDTTERAGVALPTLTAATVAELETLLDPGLEPANPVDAWGTGRNATEVFVGCMRALATDPGVGVVAFCVDLTAEADLSDAYGGAAIQAARGSDVPVCVLANMTSTIDPAQAEHLRSAGIPVLEGTETGIRAIGHLIEHARRLARPPAMGRMTRPLEADDAQGLLDGYGIVTPRTASAANVEDVVAAASEIGYPIVMKAAGIDHKTEVGGVVLGIGDEATLRKAYGAMTNRLGQRVTLSEQVAPGVEVGLGVVNDAQFGPILLVAAGGTLIEVLRDHVALIPPVDAAAAKRALMRLAISEVLDGVRGGPPADTDALAEMIARFSELAVDHSSRFTSMDLNPVIVGPDRAVAVDVLMRERG